MVVPPVIYAVISIMAFVNAVSILDYTGVSGFQNPQSADAALVKYNSAPFRASLESAWYNAEKAKNEAIKFSFSLNVDNFTMSLTLIDSYYKNVMSSTKDVFSQLKARAVSDYLLLDGIGVDSENNTGVSKQKLKKLESFFASFESADSSSCSGDLRDLNTKISCIQSKTHAWSVYDGVFVFNNLVSLDEYSVLSQMEALHNDAVEINESMHEEYAGKLREVNFLSEKLSAGKKAIDGEKIYLVTREHQNAIKTRSSSAITASPSGSLQERASRVDIAASDCLFSKESAEAKFKSKSDNYLIDAIVLLSEASDELTASVGEAALIMQDANSLRNTAREQLHGMLKNSTRIGDPLYLKAAALYDEAELEKTGPAIVSYSRGIELLESLQNYDFNAEILEIKQALNSLKSLGYDVSSLENQVNSIKVSAENSGSTRLALDGIKESIYEIIYDISGGIQSKKSKAQAFISSAEALLAADYDSGLLGKTQEYSQKFDASLSKDLFSNAYEVSSLYDEIILYYTEYFSVESEKYVSANFVPGVYFSEVPACNKSQKVTFSAVVTNGLPIALANVHTAVEAFNKSVPVDITVLEPGKQAIFSEQYYATPVSCSPQKNSESSGYYYSEIDAEAAFPVSQAIVRFSIPSGMEVVSVIPSYSFHDGQCLATGLNGKQKIIVQYRKGNGTSVAFNATLSSYSDAESKVDLSNAIEDVCFFANCSAIKSMNSSAAEEAVGREKLDIASRLSGSKALQNLLAINRSISLLSKALDSDSEVVPVRNYSSYEGVVGEYSSSLDSFSEFFAKISGTSFDEMISLYSKAELKTYLDGVEKLGDDVNSSIKSAEALAKVKLSDSVEYYKSNPELLKDYLQKAKDAFDSGYFLRSMMYSDFIAETASEKQFPFQYVALALVVTGAGFYIFKKPSENSVQKREIQRKIRSV